MMDNKVLRSLSKNETDQIERITQAIGLYYSEEHGGVALPVLEKIDRDYWSIILIYKLSHHGAEASSENIFCKIPKSRWDVCTVDGILKNDSEASRRMAEIEYRSLKHLNDFFDKNIMETLGVINPVCFLSEFNAVLTNKMPCSFEVFGLLRKYAVNNGVPEHALQLIRQIGQWASVVHSGKGITALSPHDTYLEQLQDLKVKADKLMGNCEGFKFVDEYITYLEKTILTLPDLPNDTLVIEGFEVRNFITDGKSVNFLDPGEITRGPCYEDLSRFVASVALLFWGGPRFMLSYKSERLFADTFLSAYEKGVGVKVDMGMLELYLAKQYLKLWMEALVVLKFKSYPWPLGLMIRRIYIERFYRARLNALRARGLSG